MPEGDTIATLATRLADVLVGARVERLTGTHRSVVGEGRRIAGTNVCGVAARGKHLIIEFDNRWALRTHLGMTGSWDLYSPEERWRRSPGKARAVLETGDHVAVCFVARSIELAPTATVRRRLSILGPDLLDEPLQSGAMLELARRSNAATVADLLLDQSVMAGLGNVYKSEVLFLERVSPSTPVDSATDATLVGLARRGSRLLSANVGTSVRSSTGSRRPRERHWVYGRDGKPCRRCGTVILAETHGPHARVTYRCPQCQDGPR